MSDEPKSKYRRIFRAVEIAFMPAAVILIAEFSEDSAD
jgi:hypothetical protein